MNSKNIKILGITIISISIFIIILSMTIKIVLLLYIGILFLVVSTFLTILALSLDVFRQDRILDKEALEKSGLHIVTCKECHKENVYEDKFCVYCGEELIMNDE